MSDNRSLDGSSGPGQAQLDRRVGVEAGILGTSIFFPQTYIDQPALEVYDGVSSGKYTIGLGQKQLAVTLPSEDAISLCSNAVLSLLRTCHVQPCEIGRLDVATESRVDMCKAAKTVIQELAGLGNDVQGSDVVSACYAGTQAVLNAIAWVESRDWDGRMAIVVCGDILQYNTVAARPTGGAGAVAILIGANPTFSLEPFLKSHWSLNVYDFYRPLSSSFPIVDGNLSIQTYYTCLDQCYTAYKKKFRKQNGQRFTVHQDVDYAVFHSPFSRLAEKAFSRLHYLDCIDDESNPYSSALSGGTITPGEGKVISFCEDRDLERSFLKACKEEFLEKVQPSQHVSNRLGNLATASLWGGLHSLLSTLGEEAVVGKRVLLFSYGSGAASCLCSLVGGKRVRELGKCCERDLVERLDSRICLDPGQYFEDKTSDEVAATAMYTSSEFYYLHNIDKQGKREYAVGRPPRTSSANLSAESS